MRPPRLHQVSEENVGEAAVVEDVPDQAGSHGIRAGVDAVIGTPVLSVDSPEAGARQGPDGASDKLGGSRQVVRKGVYHGRGHTDEGPSRRATKRLSGPWWRTRCTCRHPLPLFSCSHEQKRAADGVTEAGRSCKEKGNLLLKGLSQGAGAIEFTVDIPPCLGCFARLCRLVVDLQLACGRLPPKPHARPGVQGGCATQRQNHESTVAVPLRPGAQDRPARRSSQPRPTCSQ